MVYSGKDARFRGRAAELEGKPLKIFMFVTNVDLLKKKTINLKKSDFRGVWRKKGAKMIIYSVKAGKDRGNICANIH